MEVEEEPPLIGPKFLPRIVQKIAVAKGHDEDATDKTVKEVNDFLERKKFIACKCANITFVYSSLNMKYTIFFRCLF